ncbi:MAG: sulfurtransferase TusA family protein [Oscillospiraceae bacterium]|nr:sulfurtransferase TusA family protein [Oscillospiraceae bacterium]
MVDARGYSCPIPVIMVQKAVKDNPDKLEVLVDNQTAVGNVTRFANNNGYDVAVKELEDDEYSLALTKR